MERSVWRASLIAAGLLARLTPPALAACDVRPYGAQGGGKTNGTRAIQAGRSHGIEVSGGRLS
ncbi:MAG: hypothetical protein HY821_04885 [Acidobacteria bacterium]|nr:hypothetical protein [Acidobacteriota bacterium]